MSGKKDTKPDSVTVAIRPPVFTMGLSCVAGAVAQVTDRRPIHNYEVSLGQVGGRSVSLGQLLGSGLMVGAFAFVKKAKAYMISKGTHPRHGNKVAGLIRGGPFEYTRNPMYVGLLAALTGPAIMSNNWVWAAVPLISWVYLHFYIVPKEEGFMRTAFGNEYEAYCGEVGRWVFFL